MMQKLMSNKKIIICACAAVAVTAVVVIALLFNKEEAFRSIMVYDVKGSAVIERETVGAMNAAENLYLESGDCVSVAADSSMRMKLDDDKYVMAEPDTVFSVEAEGTEADSRTRICLEQGAITNEIQHPLSEGSQYETSTPNSVMAVRGTIYRVELSVDENGDQNTKLCCFQGKVATKPVLSDGTYGEEILVPAGSELVVYQDGTMGEVSGIAYDELPRQAVVNLLDMMENGQEVSGISKEELTQFASEKEDAGEAPESGDEQEQQPENERTEQTAASEEPVSAADTQIHTKIDAAKNVPVQSSMGKPQAPAIKPTDGQPAPQPQAPLIQPQRPAEPMNSGSVNQGSTEGNDFQNENAGNGSDEDKSDEDKKDEDKDKPAKPRTYKVTFMYQGEVFATQTVERGKTAAAPVLAPAQNGAWDFDFGTKIKADVTVSWK